MSDTLLEVLVAVAEVLAMTILTALGLLAEQAGFATLASGVDLLTVWFMFVGAIALYAGVVKLGFERVLPRALALF